MPAAGEPSGWVTLPEMRVDRRIRAVSSTFSLSGSSKGHCGREYDDEPSMNAVPGWMSAGIQSKVAIPLASLCIRYASAERFTAPSFPFLRIVKGPIAAPGTGLPAESSTRTRTVRVPSRISWARSGAGDHGIAGMLR